MSRLFSGASVLALTVAKIVLFAGGTGCANPMVSSATIERHVVPNRLGHMMLEGFESVASLDVDLHTAVDTREAVEIEFKTAYGRAGHLRWFFYAFDDKTL
ncbi:MAG TPA: hypothetical protein VM580_16395, partial [Labilithrix sp.]|nr:hypothetical protein [Labilithrix sp.]